MSAAVLALGSSESSSASSNYSSSLSFVDKERLSWLLESSLRSPSISSGLLFCSSADFVSSSNSSGKSLGPDTILLIRDFDLNYKEAKSLSHWAVDSCCVKSVSYLFMTPRPGLLFIVDDGMILQLIDFYESISRDVESLSEGS